MHSLINKEGKEIGSLYNNILLLPKTKVAGMLLGHCAYSKKGKVVGKFFGQVLYNDKGEVIARQGISAPMEIDAATDKCIMDEFWEIMALTENHTGPWITPSEKWAKESLEKFLLK